MLFALWLAICILVPMRVARAEPAGQDRFFKLYLGDARWACNGNCRVSVFAGA